MQQHPDPLAALLNAIDRAGLAEADAEAWRAWFSRLVAGDQPDQAGTAIVVQSGFKEQKNGDGRVEAPAIA